jgi:hypothetical protein
MEKILLFSYFFLLVFFLSFGSLGAGNRGCVFEAAEAMMIW